MNKADKKQGVARYLKNRKTCVFISHKAEDKEIALEVGRFLMDTMNMDIYLDFLILNSRKQCRLIMMRR